MTEPLWRRDAVAAATRGRTEGPNWSAYGLSIDTRSLDKGDLFIALKDRRDGHDFVADAFAAGAAAPPTRACPCRAMCGSPT